MLSSTEENLKILEAVDDFFIFLQTNNYSPKTLYNYEKDLLVFSQFLNLKKITVSSFDKRLVNEFKAYLASEDRAMPTSGLESRKRLSSASINRCLSAVRSYLRFLIDNDYKCPVMPDSFKMVRRERPHPRVAELNEIISLIEAPSKLEKDPIVSSRNRAILEVLFATGMRVSELTSLNCRDLNDSGRIFITGKGRKQRFVYLTERAMHHLESYLKLRNDAMPALFVPTKGRTVNSKDKRITSRYVENILQKYRELLRINIPVTPHSLRHGFATYLAEEGASPAAIQMLLGHESLATTTRYVNASDRFAQESHRKFHPLSKADGD